MQDYYASKGELLTLTDRRNIKRWLREGHSNREIARRLAKVPQPPASKSHQSAFKTYNDDLQSQIF